MQPATELLKTDLLLGSLAYRAILELLLMDAGVLHVLVVRRRSEHEKILNVGFIM